MRRSEPTIRLFLLFEGACFALASLIHSGRLIQGYQHPQARLAEGIIGVVLVLGLLATWVRPARLRTIALVVQGFALLGTLVGVFTIVVGVGPRTPPDIAYHLAILLLLTAGLIVALRMPSPERQPPPVRRRS